MRILKSYKLEIIMFGRKKFPQRNLENGAMNPKYELKCCQNQMIGSWLIISMNDDLIKEDFDYDTSTRIWCVWRTILQLIHELEVSNLSSS